MIKELRARAVFCRSGEKAAAADHFLAVRTDGERNARFAHDLAQSVFTLHKYEALALSHVLRPYSSRNLDVARRIYNYRLTRAIRIFLCAFGIVCNKWRLFTVRLTFAQISAMQQLKHVAYCTTSFVRETAFSFRVLHTNVPSRVLRLLAIEVMLQERIWGGGIRGQECLSVGEPGRGLVYRGLMYRTRVWRRAPLSIGTALGYMGGPSTGNSEGELKVGTENGAFLSMGAL